MKFIIQDIYNNGYRRVNNNNRVRYRIWLEIENDCGYICTAFTWSMFGECSIYVPYSSVESHTFTIR